MQTNSTTYNMPVLYVSYKVSFYTRFLNTLNAMTASFLGISSKSRGTNPKEAPEIRPINHGHRYLESYRDRLCSLYTEPAYAHLRFERWQVSEIRTYKDKGCPVKHEYLVATVYDENNVEILLRIERRVQDADVNEPNGQSSLSSSKKVACDQITLLSPSAFKDDQLPVSHLQFRDGHHVPLPKLVVLACTVNEHCRAYNALLSNCYWFCHVTSEALKKVFNFTVVPVEGGSQQGWLYGLPLCGNVDIGVVVKEYHKAWDEFVQKIDEIKNNPNNEHTIAAKKLAAEERQRADILAREVRELRARMAMMT